jgi:spore germination protein YaaH
MCNPYIIPTNGFFQEKSMNTASRLTFRALLGFAAFLLTCTLQSLQAQQSSGFERVFYMIDSEESYRSFERNADYIDYIGPQCLKVDENGIVWGTVDKRVLALAKKKNIKVIALIVNPGFNQESLHKLLLSSVAQERAVAGMLEVCRTHALHGIQFDFENIHIADRDLFTGFFKRAADSLRKYSFGISIACVPRPNDYAGISDYQKWMYEYWRGGYDYGALGKIADFVSYMTYDQHTRRTTPGPVAGFVWVENCLKYILQQVPREKVSLGVALYTDYWYQSFQNPQQISAIGRSLNYPDAVGIMEANGGTMQWHERDKVHFTMFERDTLYEYMFFENAKSFQARLDLAKKYNLRGISAWRLGQEDPDIFKALGKK